MEKQKKAIKIVLGLFFSIILVISLIVLFHKMDQVTRSESQLINLEDGWTISTKGSTVENYKLSDYYIKDLNIGDTIEFIKVLPDNLYFDPTINLYISHCAFSMFLENELIYEYGQNLLEKGVLIGGGYFWISLPDDYQGKELKIEMTLGEKDSVSYMHPVYLGEENDILKTFFTYNRYPIFTSTFLIMIGILFLIAALFMLFFMKSSIRIVYIGLFSMMVGIWSFSDYRLMPFFILDQDMDVFIEYISLYLLPCIVTLLFYEIRKKDKVEKITYMGFFILNTVFFILTYSLQIMNLFHLPYFLRWFHKGMIAEILITLILMFGRRRKESRAEKVLLAGLISFIVISMLDILLYNAIKYHSLPFFSEYVSLTPIGALAFIFALLISYFLEIVDGNKEKIKKEYYMELAYRDQLTQLYNRTKCTEIIEEYEEKNINFSIISMDLNNLKEFNDHRGHHSGDLLISGMADLLKECFENYGEIGRMGGDEFIVILPNVIKKQIEFLLKKFEVLIAAENEKRGELIFSISYGYAMKEETKSGEFKEIYTLADQRMYEMKQHHYERKDHKKVRKYLEMEVDIPAVKD